MSTRNTLLLVALVATLTPIRAEQTAPRPAPATLLGQAIAAQGGAALETGGPITIDVIGHQAALEQSERPEGPWMLIYQQRKETRDAVRGQLAKSQQWRFWGAAAWTPLGTTIISDSVAARRSGERWAPGRPQDITAAQETLELAPERLLLTARSASDLRSLADRRLQGVLNRGVAFTWRGHPMQLFINANTSLPTLLDYERDDTFGVWGDVHERRWYSFWSLEAGGLWYPRQVTTEWNGLPWSEETALDVKVNDPAAATAFSIPDDVRSAFAANAAKAAPPPVPRLDETRAIRLSDTVVVLPGSWYVTLVHQPDGVVVLEAPISAQYTADVIAFAARTFPGARLKAVVTTSDAWPHIGGVREYVARGVPVYRLDLNAGILDRLVAAPHTRTPDALARSPLAPVWHTVSDRLVIGAGDSRIELLPARGETSERMMFAWLPGLRLLYSSDMIQPGQNGGFFMPGMLAEVETAVVRAHIEPERATGMHLSPTNWTEIRQALAKARSRER